MRLTFREVASFWAAVTKPAIEYQESACWLWTGATHPALGPALRVHRFIDGPVCRMPRGAVFSWASAREVSWQLAHGVVHMDQKLVSTCGNDLCINPAHMVLAPLV